MCDGCWHMAGSPTDWTPQTPQLLELIEDLYAIHPTGGPLRTVLGDWNLDRTIIEPSYDGWSGVDLDALHCDGWPLADLPPEAPAVTEGLGRSMRQICDEIAKLLNGMTVAQRYAALAYRDGFVARPSDDEQSPQ